MTSDLGKGDGRRGAAARRLTALALIPAMLAAPLQAAQNAPQTAAPAPQPPKVVVTQPPRINLPQAVLLPAPLPALTPAQAAQLRTLVDADVMAQGLRSTPAAPAAAVDNDTLVRAALDHARAVHAGRLAESDFDRNWGLRPPPYDPLPAFADAIARDRLAAWIASLPPPYAGYDGLRKGLDTYRAIADAGGWTALETGPDLTLGAKGPRVLALRQRLAFEDKDVVATGDIFDAELVASVQRAQRRYGLNPQGVVSVKTLAALNVPAADRVRQIMANLERWRWLPQELPRDRIQVNIAAAVLTVFDGDTPVMSMRGVTGRPGHETPMLSSTIKSLVINPPWNVPSSIATAELWPKEKKSPGYLKRNGFKVIDGTRLQQAAGNQSALGRFKFDFDNAYAVYLHDTPSRAKFASFDRLASHGCVRLEKPAELAALLLNDDPAWTPASIAAAVATGKTQRVTLTTPVQVYLLYWTAFASTSGQMNFRDDPYGWDRTLAAKIEARSARLVLPDLEELIKG
ncbi:MAG: peptidoglycan-binding protein [Sphingomonas bacterium]|uniref:L,D-transpeptidase family protein n=1 Tax=Sphingomonas bacterium TaxID=1895847 RepID=UPI00261EF3DA|nr:L,D-transpeptidase family protein [Sphingomonas bacterium]MDB5704662.1 peptidoglycan-binding protein [Sphingomonas bacterium]